MQVDELLKPFPIKEFHPFPRAMLGPGAHEMIGPEALKLGFKKSLVMTSGLRGSDIIHKITESMKYHGLEVVIYDKVESNPKDYNVMDAVGLYQQNDCDSFVSIGGGSSHDACKGARISVAHDGRNVNEFEGFNKSREPEEPAAHRRLHHGGHRLGDVLGLRHHRHHDRPGQPAQVRGVRRRLRGHAGDRRPGAVLQLPGRLHRAVRLRRARPCVRAVRLAAELPAVARQRVVRDQADRREPAGGRVERPGPPGPRGHDVRAVHRGAGVQLGRPGHHPLDLPRHQRVLRPPPRPQQRDRAAARVGVQHAGGLQAVRRHRGPDGRRHLRDDRRAGRGGRARRGHPAAARRGHPGAVRRRHAGLLLEEPARPGPDEVLRERQGRQG